MPIANSSEAIVRASCREPEGCYPERMFLYLAVALASGATLLIKGSAAGDASIQVLLTVAVLCLSMGYAGIWRVLVKAGRPGSHAFYRLHDVIEMIGWPPQEQWLFAFPFMFTYGHLSASIHLSHSFGRGTTFGLGLFLFPCVFFPILGFGHAVYRGPSGPLDDTAL
jgi:hypothetical protein